MWKSSTNNEQQYLLSFNVNSDGNIDSEFFRAQIEVEFTEPIGEVEIILLKSKVSEAFRDNFGFDLYGNIKPTVEEVVQMCSRYKRIIFNNEDDLKRFISEWNEILVEDLKEIEIKSYLKAKSIPYNDDFRGLKSLEVFLNRVLDDQTNMIAPLFYLNDLRIWADHKEAHKKYQGVLSSLGLDSNATSTEVYYGLLIKIHSFMKDLLENVYEK